MEKEMLVQLLELESRMGILEIAVLGLYSQLEDVDWGSDRGRRLGSAVVEQMGMARDAFEKFVGRLRACDESAAA